MKNQPTKPVHIKILNMRYSSTYDFAWNSNCRLDKLVYAIRFKNEVHREIIFNPKFKINPN